MKKGSTAAIIIVIAIVVIGGGYALLHKSNKSNSTSSTSSAPSSKNNARAVNNAVLTTKTDASLGQYLADPSGKALYTYSSDSSGVSKCSGACLASWPAYQDTGSTANLPTGVSTLTRSDNGQIQYTYNGMPLYYFASDSSGKVTGNGVDSFEVAKPASASSSNSSSSTPSPAPAPSSSSNSSPNYNY